MEVIYRQTETLKKLENNPRSITEKTASKAEGIHTEKSGLFRSPANFRFGEWYFQHYHSTADVCRLTEEFIGSDFKIYEKGIEVDKSRELRGSSFQVSVLNERKASRKEYMEALRYEFTLPLPNNRRWDLDKEILPVFEKL